MRIVFFGTPIFAKIILESLYSDDFFHIVGLVTQEDKPFGRKKERKMPECKEFILQSNPEIPIFQPSNPNEIFDDIKQLQPDIILVVAYGKILPKNIIDRFTCINIHGSILPKSRGASPIQDMILRNDEFIGITIIKMDNKLDNGDILAMRFIQYRNYDILQASEILANNAAELSAKTLKSLHQITPLPQIHIDSSYCKKITKNDGNIYFINAERIYRKYLAYKSWPGIFLSNGTKLFDIAINEIDSCNNAGEILDICDDYIVIGCKKGSIIAKSIQAVGKNKIDIIVYLRGKRLHIGDIIV